MHNQHIKNKLLLSGSIKDNDPYKESKKRQIARWYHAHWILTNYWREGDSLAFQEIFGDQDCWESTNTIEKFKLNRYILGKKLLVLKTEDEKGLFLSAFDRYSIACWCCFEEEIKNIFEEIKLQRNNISAEELVNKLDEGLLMIFWSHVMNNQEQQLELNNDHLYVYGFRCAIFERIVEALEFFWDKLQSVDTLSLDQKDDLLMEVALYKKIHRSPTAEIIEFAINHLNQDKYPELLKRDLEQNSGYSTISILKNEYFFESAKKLFQFLNPQKFDYEDYSCSISSILDTMKSSLSNNNLISACEDYLTFIWHVEGFESHKKYFLDKLTRTVCWSRNLIADIVRANKATTILSEIINALSPAQMEDIKENSESIYEEFIKVRSTSRDNSIVRQLSDLSLDREYLQQEIVAFPEADSVSEIEKNTPTSSVEQNSPDLFNPGLSDEASGRGC